MSSQRMVRCQVETDGQTELSANFPSSFTFFSFAGTSNNESSFSDNIRRPSSSVNQEGPSSTSKRSEINIGSGPTSGKTTTNSIFNLGFTPGSTLTSDSHYEGIFARPSGRAPRSLATPSLFAALATPGHSRAAAPPLSPLPAIQPSPQLFGNSVAESLCNSLPPSTPQTRGIHGGPPAITPRLTAGRTTVATPSATPRTGRARHDDNVIVGKFIYLYPS